MQDAGVADEHDGAELARWHEQRGELPLEPAAEIIRWAEPT